MGQNTYIGHYGHNIHIEDTMGRIYIERTLWAEYTYRGHYGQNIHIEDTMGQNIHIEDV